jgi:hypothetical protein
MKILKLICAITSIIFLSSYTSLKPQSDFKTKKENSKIIAFATSNLYLASVVTGVTVTRITYDDASQTPISVAYPPLNYTYDVFTSNDISVRITGSFNSVSIQTSGGSDVDRQYYSSGGTNTFYFYVNLNAGDTYKIVVD